MRLTKEEFDTTRIVVEEAIQQYFPTLTTHIYTEVPSRPEGWWRIQLCLEPGDIHRHSGLRITTIYGYQYLDIYHFTDAQNTLTLERMPRTTFSKIGIRTNHDYKDHAEILKMFRDIRKHFKDEAMAWLQLVKRS